MSDSASPSAPPSPAQETKPQLSDNVDVPPQDRSRNAKAQARHRAKRKAYIEHLESTVTNLKTALARLGQDGMDSRSQQLSQENAQLRAEVQSLRSQIDVLTASTHTRRLTPPMSANISTISLDDDESKFNLMSAPAAKKRKHSDDLGDQSNLGPALNHSDHQHGSGASPSGFNLGGLLGLAPIRAPPHIQQHHIPLNLNMDVNPSLYIQNGLGLRPNSSASARPMFNLGSGLPPPPQYNGSSNLARNSLLSSPALLTPLSAMQGPSTPTTPSYALGRSPDHRHLQPLSATGLPTPISATRDSMVRSSFMSQLDTPLSLQPYQQSFMSLPSPFPPRSAPSNKSNSNAPNASPNTSLSSLSSRPSSPMTPPQSLGDDNLPDFANSKLQIPMSAIGMSQPSPFGSGYSSGNTSFTSTASFDWSIGLSQEVPALQSLTGTSSMYNPGSASLHNSSNSNSNAGGYPFPRVMHGVGASASLDDNSWGNSSSIVVTDMTSSNGQGQGVAN